MLSRTKLRFSVTLSGALGRGRWPFGHSLEEWLALGLDSGTEHGARPGGHCITLVVALCESESTIFVKTTLTGTLEAEGSDTGGGQVIQDNKGIPGDERADLRGEAAGGGSDSDRLRHEQGGGYPPFAAAAGRVLRGN